MWDANQRAGFPALVDMEWGGSYALQRYKGRAWMSYFGGTGRGYEAIEAPPVHRCGLDEGRPRHGPMHGSRGKSRS